MVKLAIADNPAFELSRIELDRPGPHYTLDTINLIAKQNPDADIVPIIGGDSLREIRYNYDGFLSHLADRLGG